MSTDRSLSSLRSAVGIGVIVAAVVVVVVVVAGWAGRFGNGTRERSAASEQSSAFTESTIAPTPSSEPSEALAPIPKTYVDARTSYAKMTQDEAVAATIKGFPEGVFDHLELVEPDAASDSPARLEMHATVNTDSENTPGSGTRAYWEACLAQGALAERLAGDATDLNTVVDGVNVTTRFADGTSEVVGGCGGDIAPGEVFDAQAKKMTDQDMVESVNKALASFGLVPDRVTVLHPLGPAISVVATAPNQGSIEGRFADIRNAILGEPFQYEGIYLEIRGEDGSPLARSGGAFRAGTGIVWWAPGEDQALGLLHGGQATGGSPASPSIAAK